MRRYREEKEWNILTVLDIRESLRYGDGTEKKETMKSIIELIGQATLSAGESFWGYILSKDRVERIAPKKQKTVILEMQKDVLWGREIDQVLELKFLLQKNIKRSIVFVISDSRDIDIISLKQVAQKHDVIYVHISSNFESSLRESGVVYLEGKTLGRAINLENDTQRQEYITKRTEKLEDFWSRLRKIGVDSIFIDSESSILPKFLQCMQMRKKI